MHLIAKNLAQLAQQIIFVAGGEHGERLAVDVHHPDFRHALVHKLGMHTDEHAEIFNALLANAIQQSLYPAEVFNPKRHG